MEPIGLQWEPEETRWHGQRTESRGQGKLYLIQSERGLHGMARTGLRLEEIQLNSRRRPTEPRGPRMSQVYRKGAE